MSLAGPAGVKPGGRQKGGGRVSFSRPSVGNRTAALWTLTPARKGILLQVMTSCRETRRTQERAASGIKNARDVWETERRRLQMIGVSTTRDGMCALGRVGAAAWGRRRPGPRSPRRPRPLPTFPPSPPRVKPLLRPTVPEDSRQPPPPKFATLRFLIICRKSAPFSPPRVLFLSEPL